MSPDEFAAALEASRRFEAEVAGAKFSLRLPSEHAWNLAMQTHNDAQGQPIRAAVLRDVAEQSVLGWDGVRLTHVLSDAPDEPLPFSAGNLAMLLEQRQDIADGLAVKLSEKFFARREALGAARKN